MEARMSDQADADGVSRRELLGRAAAATAGAAAVAVAPGAALADEKAALAAEMAPPAPGDTVVVTMTVNGTRQRLRVDPRVTLLDAVRDRLRLTGTKKGCDQGQCGACTVHVDGDRVLACLTLVATVQGRAVTTVEGLAAGDTLHPVQQAFIDCDGLQCGFCTPGQVMSAVAVLREGTARTDPEIREEMSGNLCRCGAYNNIVEAIRSVRAGQGGR
jgi:xanthine dehydrogenase YagT iron-sulfur-binding subunit